MNKNQPRGPYRLWRKRSIDGVVRDVPRSTAFNWKLKGMHQHNEYTEDETQFGGGEELNPPRSAEREEYENVTSEDVGDEEPVSEEPRKEKKMSHIAPVSPTYLKKFLISNQVLQLYITTASTAPVIWERVRAKHIVICCLWFGNEKPNVDTFLEPFIIQARRLSKKGFQWKDSSGRNHISKVAFPLLVADAPARAMLTNFMQYNGSYGCGFCEHEGKRVAKGDGTVQVYPLVHPLPPNRSHEKSYEQAQTATLSLTQHVGGERDVVIVSASRGCQLDPKIAIDVIPMKK
ncbi:hypothetical protein DAPPUDRAFT_263574 [Daphnia pulex]|uniref:Uncharacterized protein n=1 Tax=Daphnia pulex TaxID=6669 RepID=E9HQ08_DAPPU|nr:hypothetical protein DAPPUDRAFT_263574 [Daphnia pulex]|eukprot:EFX66177.1 hypothetical protein DAPPUDRAFT_263574 [Daphnia pulex]